MRNQNGFITADFMFAIVLVCGMTAILFAINFTLVVASITQYVTFAAARNYVVGNVDQATQQQRAVAKYQQLIANPVFAPMYKNGWFKVSQTPDVVGDATQLIQGYQSNASSPNLFFGVGTYFTAMILDFKIPFFGSTSPGSDGSGTEFKTFVGSYLGRDVTAAECMAFVKQRWTNIQALPGTAYSTAQGSYVPNSDDGC